MIALLSLLIFASPSEVMEVQTRLDRTADFVALCLDGDDPEPLRLRFMIAPGGKLTEVELVSGTPSDWECVEFSLYSAEFPVWEKATTVELDYVVGPDPQRDARDEKRAFVGMARLLKQISTIPSDCYRLTRQGDYFCLRGGAWVALPKAEPANLPWTRREPAATERGAP